MTYSPDSIYEMLIALRQREGLDRDAACEKLARTLDWTKVGADSGAWFLRMLESSYHRRRGFDGGHQGGVNHHAASPASAPSDNNARDQTIVDAQNGDVAGDSNGKGGHCQRDAHNVPAARPATRTNGGSGGHSALGTHSAIAPGPPWYEIVPCNFEIEVGLKGVGRKRAGSLTKRDLLTAAAIMERSAQTEMDSAANLRRMAAAMKRDDETLEEAWARKPNGTLRAAVTKFLPRSAAAA